MTGRILAFAYGVLSYAVFLGTFLYGIGFLGDVLVPRSIGSPPAVPVGQALVVNLALLLLFALQHSVMARPAFKRWWTRLVPLPVERSTYVLFSSLALILLFRLWQPMGGMVWEVRSPAGQAFLYGLFALGWLTILVAAFIINHFDLFGLRQVWLCLLGRPYTRLRFTTPGPYRYIRHPLYAGWLLASWATPTMTAAHLVFALACTTYILVAIQFEERDLMKVHEAYGEYRLQVPMLLPWPSARWEGGEKGAGDARTGAA